MGSSSPSQPHLKPKYIILRSYETHAYGQDLHKKGHTISRRCAAVRALRANAALRVVHSFIDRSLAPHAGDPTPSIYLDGLWPGHTCLKGERHGRTSVFWPTPEQRLAVATWKRSLRPRCTDRQCNGLIYMFLASYRRLFTDHLAGRII